MNTRRTLLDRLLRENPFQPATGWWRAIELAAVIDYGIPPGAGLDLGCGDGKLMRILIEASRPLPSLVGVDIDPLETRDAVESGVYRRVHTCPAERIPEADAAFDFVYSNSVLEHIENIESVIAEVGRVLRPGGRFLFTVPGANFHKCLAGPLLPWSDRRAYLDRIDRRCAHRRYWGDPQWRACLGRHGLEVVRTVEYLTAAQMRRWETLSRFTAGVLYAVFGERKRPIEIQRALKLRGRALRMPRWAAGSLAPVISAGVADGHEPPFGCLLVDARRPA